MIYSEIIQSLAQNISNYFDKVYHSAEIITTDSGERFPAASIKDEWISLVPTDQRETLYIRRNGDDEVVGDAKLGSCIKSYNMRSQLRIVYFKDNANNEAQIIFKLLQSVLTGHTKLNKIIRDKWKLQKEETSNSNYNFGATTVYLAIDIYALWTLQPDVCENDFCITIDNPLCKQ